MEVQILGGLDLFVVLFGPETLGVHFPPITTELRKTAYKEEHGLSRLLESLSVTLHEHTTHDGCHTSWRKGFQTGRWVSHLSQNGPRNDV